MYKLFIISYSGTKESEVKETVKALGSWFNYFDNQYILCSSSNIQTVKEAIDIVIKQGSDKLLILEVDIKDIRGWLNSNGWEWVKAQQQKIKKTR